MPNPAPAANPNNRAKTPYRAATATERSHLARAILIEGAFKLNLGDSEVLTIFLAITALTYVAVSENSVLFEPATP